LAEHFMRVQSRGLGRTMLELSEEHQRALLGYDWPGNVRELMHVIERAVILSRDRPLRLDLALPSPSAGPAEPVLPKGHLLSDAAFRALERDNLLAALDRCSYRIAGPGGAAELLGLSPSTLRDRMRAFDIQRKREEAT
jgi:DNA-binding NtrC family response regulator